VRRGQGIEREERIGCKRGEEMRRQDKRRRGEG
jgi:hypothetical protein